MPNNTIMTEMREVRTSWSDITTYQGDSETNDVIGLVVDCLRSMQGEQFFDVLPDRERGEWTISTSIKKTEHVFVMTLSKDRAPAWTEPTRTDFDARIHVYWNDMGTRRLELSFSGDGPKDRVFDALATLAMKTKLAAA